MKYEFHFSFSCLGRRITIPSISSVIISHLIQTLFFKNAQITAHSSQHRTKPKELDSVCIGKISTKCLKKEMELWSGIVKYC